MKLLGTPGSPYARKVHVVLEEKGIPFEYVLARPSDPTARVSDFNPLGKVPVLIRDDSTPLYDSSVIVEYLDALVSTNRLIPEAFSDRIEVKRWEALGDGILDATVAISHDLRDGGRQTEKWHARQQKKIEAGLATMEADLGEREFCFRNHFSLADVSCGVALGYLDRSLPEFEWRPRYPGLHAQAERLTSRESFRKTQPD